MLLSEFSDNSVAVLFPLYFRDVADHVPQAVQFPTLFPTLFLCGKTPVYSPPDTTSNIEGCLGRAGLLATVSNKEKCKQK